MGRREATELMIRVPAFLCRLDVIMLWDGTGPAVGIGVHLPIADMKIVSYQSVSMVSGQVRLSAQSPCLASVNAWITEAQLADVLSTLESEGGP